MNSPVETSGPPDPMTRRDAIRRTAAMLGVAMTPRLMTAVLEAQTASGGGAGSLPRYLTPGQFATAAAMAERILPKTDTPGAADVGVPAFLDLMYGKYLTEEERTRFTTGLDELDASARTKRRAGFAELAPAQQDELMTDLARASQGRQKTFFHLIRDLTVLGYFTSEPVGKHVLHYDPVPGRYEGCIPLAEVGNRAWTR